MGLENNTGNATFVNISNGKLVTKKKNEEPVFFDAISGTITKVQFKDVEFEGQKFEKAEIFLIDGNDKFILSIKTDSGYFRGFVNSLKSGNPSEKVRISPNMKEVDGKTTTTCFVSQNNKPLKHAHTKDNPGDFPQMKRVRVNGKDVWDGTAQIEYWKNWLLSLKFEPEFISSFGASQLDEIPDASDIKEPLSDLPF